MVSIISAGLPFLPVLLFGKILAEIYFVNPDKCTPNSVKDERLENSLRELFLPELEKNGIKKDLQFRLMPYDPNSPFNSSAGGTLTKYPTIFVSSEFGRRDPAAWKWSVKHEMGHIKNNDSLCHLSLNMITSIALGVLLPQLIGTGIVAGSATCVITVLTTGVIRPTLRRYQEARADDFAITNATDEELCGAIRLHKAQHKYDVKGFWAKHPPSLSRADKCRDELAKRGKEYTESPSDQLKIINLENLIL